MIDNSQNIFQAYADLERPLVVSNKLISSSTISNQTPSKQSNQKRLTVLILGAILIIACVSAPGYYFASEKSNETGSLKGLSLIASESSQQNLQQHVAAPLEDIQESLPKKQTRLSLLENQQASLSLQSSFVPSSFDLRTQAKAIGCNFNRIDEKLCVGGNWSNVIASAVSLTICLSSAKNIEVKLSAQYILDCSTLVDRCDILASREDFEAQLTMVQNSGLPSASCLPYNPLKYKIPANSCDTTCANGSALVASQKPAFTDMWDDSSISTTIANVKQHIYSTGPVIALLNHSATVTRYNGSTPNGIFVNDPSDQTDFGFRAYKIIGWDVAPGNIPYWILENTFSSNWGLHGYMRVQLNDPIIEGYYAYTPGNSA